MFKLLVLALCFTGGLSVLLDDVYDPFPFMWQREIFHKCSEPTVNGYISGECMSSVRCTLLGGTVGQNCGVGNCCTFVQKNTTCKAITSANGELEGVCMNDIKCKKSGGSPKGLCGFFEKCCIYDKSCNRITTAKVSYFEKQVKVDEDVNNCIYDVYLNSPSVCQIRLDFETFRLADASFADDKHTCVTDYFDIEPKHYNIPRICGSNDNNHVYVHLQPGDDKITLSAKIKKRTQNSNLELPYWKIKITQLQCTGSYKHIDTSQYDAPLLAPRGAIQYFMEPSGTFYSFGYKKYYTSGENYAIAFKKDPDYCGAKFTFKSMSMPTDTGSTCSDYLYIPGTEDDVSKYCAEGQAIAKVPGPLSIFFSSTAKQDSNYYFKVQYEMLTEC